MSKISIPFILLIVSFATRPVYAQVTHTVSVDGMSFTPASLDVNVGDTVDFVWGVGLHNVREITGAFDSGNPVVAPFTFSVIFDQNYLIANPRSNNYYKYLCDIHAGSGMAGSITVKTPNSPLLDLAPDQPSAGSPVTINVLNVTPLSSVRIGYSLRGPGPLSTPFGIASMTPPISILTTLSANNLGEVSLSTTVPLSLSGRTVWMQALDTTTNLLSNGAALLML